MNLDCKKEVDRIVSFIKNEFKKTEFKKVVLGISGGLDSAVVASLAKKALGQHNVYGYILPHYKQHDIKDAYRTANHLEILLTEINIGEIIDEIIFSTDIASSQDYLTRIGNLKARIRMVILYDMSVKHRALVLGTSNKTEMILGYFTVYGDGACAMEPLAHLYKTQITELAGYLEIPKELIDKAPSAGLWIGQTDEKELGGTYKEIDDILINNTFDNSELGKSLKVRIEQNKFKSKLPPTVE